MAKNLTPPTETAPNREVASDIEERTVNGQTVLWSKSLGGPVHFLTDEHVKAEVRQTILPPVPESLEPELDADPVVIPEPETVEISEQPTAEATVEVTPEVTSSDGG